MMTTEPYDPQHLRRWTLPDSYVGKSWPEYYVFLGRSRDSDTLEESNFLAGLAAIGGEDDDMVVVVRESHWAVGWIEWIGIRQDAYDQLRTADAIRARLEDYPVVDEDHWSELEWTRAADYWAQASIGERIYWISESHCGASVFAARRDDLPPDDNGELARMLAE